MTTLRPGDRVHLVSRKGRRYSIVLQKGGVFQFSGERLLHDDLIGQPEGLSVQTSRGTHFIALRPTLAEYVVKMPRGAQVIYPKDLGLILMWADIYPGAKVLEAGIGSGALTMALLRSVGEKGCVISYEIREDFAKRAQENINQFLGPTTNLIVRMNNIYEGIEDGPVDRLVLDLPEPWQVVPHAVTALRPGGVFHRNLRDAASNLEYRRTVRPSRPPDGGTFGLPHRGKANRARRNNLIRVFLISVRTFLILIPMN